MLLHTQIFYIYLLDKEENVLLNEQTKANPISLMKLVKPYMDDLIITVISVILQTPIIYIPSLTALL